MTRHDEVASSALPEGGTLTIIFEGESVLLCRSRGKLFAVQNRCTHAASPLQEGKVRNGCISCPLHGARFDLETGACMNAALGYRPLQTFPVREVGGRIEIGPTPVGLPFGDQGSQKSVG